MAVLQITAQDGALTEAFSTLEGCGAIRDAVRLSPPDRPVVFFVHGFLFDPTAAAGTSRDRRRHPHRLVLSAVDGAQSGCGWRKRAPLHLRSWPRALGFCERGSGLAIGFGWNSYPAFCRTLWTYGRNPFSVAYDAAGAAGRALARAMRCAAEAAPSQPIDVYAHSLGARVALLTLRQAAQEGWAHRIGKILALGAAEYRDEAARAARHCGSGGPEVINFISRQNDVFDLALEVFGPRRWGDVDAVALGVAGLDGAPGGSHRPDSAQTGWLTLQIDHPETRAWMARCGFALGRDPARICHWSFYTRSGMAVFHRHLLENRPCIAELIASGAPRALEPRWRRFGARGGDERASKTATQLPRFSEASASEAGLASALGRS